MKIVPYEDGCRDEWDRFVEKSPAGTLFHLIAWKRVVEKVYGWEPAYRMLRKNGELVGVIPFFKTQIPGARQTYHSLPYALYGGPLLPEGVTFNGLLPLLGWEHRKVAVRYLTTGFNPAVPTATLQLELPAEADKLWDGLKAKVRNQVRKAEKYGIEFIDGADRFGECYRVYAKNMKRLGTPAHASVFFRTVREEFGDACLLWAITAETAVIGTMLIIKFRDTWCDYMASTLSEYNYCCANMGLYWGALRAAVAAGCRTFDFGRSTLNTGTFKFKRQWGAVPLTLDYHSLQHGISTSAGVPQPGMVSAVWSRLPQKLADSLGPKVRRYLL